MIPTLTINNTFHILMKRITNRIKNNNLITIFTFKSLTLPSKPNLIHNNLNLVLKAKSSLDNLKTSLAFNTRTQ